MFGIVDITIYEKLWVSRIWSNALHFLLNETFRYCDANCAFPFPKYVTLVNASVLVPSGKEKALG